MSLDYDEKQNLGKDKDKNNNPIQSIVNQRLERRVEEHREKYEEQGMRNLQEALRNLGLEDVDNNV